MEQGSWIGRNGKALVAVGVLAAVPAVAWMAEGRRGQAAYQPPCEVTVTTAKEAVEGSPIGQRLGLHLIHVGQGAPMLGAEGWLPEGTVWCQAAAVTSSGHREQLLWRIDHVAEIGDGRVLVRAVLGQSLLPMLRDLR